ncbi:MAG: RNA polymerase sigma factor RpoD/SigA [Erysipelotrichaceae bacterium]|nr:RNA polymerase sigma factor RpoD/SigA [Erysipelotrichaceae bacterium]
MNKYEAAQQALLLLRKSKGSIEGTDIDLTIDTYKLTDQQISDFIMWINQNDLAIEINEDDISDSDNVANAYFADIARYPLLTKEQEHDLAVRVRQGDKVARETMIKSNLRLVVAIARSYQGSQLTLNDLIQEGNIGLLKAVSNYDPDRGVRFAGYAQYWIRRTISRAITQNHVIYLPANLGEKLNRLKRVQKALEQKYEKDPTAGELAEEMGMSEEEVNELLKYSFDAISMDKPLSDDGDTSMYDIIPDENGFQDELDIRLLNEIIEEKLQEIDERDAEIIRMRYGLADHKPHTLQQIADHFHLTKEGVRQKLMANLQKLKKSENLAVFLENMNDK